MGTGRFIAEDRVGEVLQRTPKLRPCLIALDGELMAAIENNPESEGRLTIAEFAAACDTPLEAFLEMLNCGAGTIDRAETLRGFPNVPIWHDGDTTCIDVRGLEAPAPMVAVLTLLERFEGEGPILAYLDRDPRHLYPELAERNWLCQPETAAPDQNNAFVLKIWKNKA